MKKNSQNPEFTEPNGECYNTGTEFATDSDEKEGITLSQLLERMKTYEVPPHIARQLGFDQNWKDKVSEEFLRTVLKSVDKYQNVLKKLSDK